MKTHASLRPRPDDDWLLDVNQVAKRLRIHPDNVWRYVKRFQVLVDGTRVVRAQVGTRGRMRLLRSAVMEHLHVELLEGRDTVGAPARARRAS